MLPKKYRLGKKEVERLYKKGRFERSAFLILRLLLNHTDHYRVAVTVPKTVSKKATERNRLRRISMIILEELAKEYDFGHIDISLAYKSMPKEEEIKSVLEIILNKLGMSREK